MKKLQLTAAAMLAAGLFCGALSAAPETPAVVPAPQKMTVGEGVYFTKAKDVDASLYSFKTDASIPKEGYRISISDKGISVFKYCEVIVESICSVKSRSLQKWCYLIRLTHHIYDKVNKVASEYIHNSAVEVTKPISIFG